MFLSLPTVLAISYFMKFSNPLFTCRLVASQDTRRPSVGPGRLRGGTGAASGRGTATAASASQRKGEAGTAAAAGQEARCCGTETRHEFLAAEGFGYESEWKWGFGG